MADEMLRCPRFVRVTYDVRSSRDRRVRVDCYLYAYTNADGEEFRKSFEVRPRQGKRPYVPQSGASAQITAMRYQW